MPITLDRDIRRVQNAKESSVASGDMKSAISHSPAVRAMRDGEQVFAQESNKQLTLYKKSKGSLWKIALSMDGNQYVDKDLEVNNDIKVFGSIGVGTPSPAGQIHISSRTDATLILEADTDNTPEGDNPKIELRQDGNAVNGFLGIEGDAGELYDNSLANTVYLESKNVSTTSSNIQFVTGGDYDAPSNGTARMTITATGKIGIATNAPSANADLTLEGGAIALKETTTPTADTNYGKLYTKSDNKLYFQDGAGSEREVELVAS